MRKIEFRWAANLLTAGNLFFGFWAIIQVIEGHFLMACWLILIASILDGLDGKIARFTRSSSEFGIELDSLVDIVSFGVAPAVLLYFISFHKYGFAGLILASLPLFFGVVRLARFNRSATIEEKKNYFGLPIPMQAASVATFIVFNYAIWGSFHLEILLIPMIISLALLMVSVIPYDTMPRFTFRDTRKNLWKVIAIIIGIILVAFKPAVIIFPLIMLYIFKGMTMWVLGIEVREEELEEAIEDEKFV